MQHYLTVISAVASVLVLTWAFVARVATGIIRNIAAALTTPSVAADIALASDDIEDEELGSLMALELDAD